MKGLMLVSALLLTGCATGGPYMESIREQRIGKNTYSITYETNKRSSKRLVADFVGRRAGMYCLLKKGRSSDIISLEVDYMDYVYSARALFKCKRLGKK